MRVRHQPSLSKTIKSCRFTAVMAASLALAACSSGTMGNTNPPPSTYTIGGTITGLSGSGLVLQDNKGDNLNVALNQKSFTFTTPITSGAAYAVTVLTQPSSPAQNCAVSNGSGTAMADVTNVQVTCTNIYTIGGTVTRLLGSGLVLQENNGDNLSLNPSGTFSNTFTFAQSIASGNSYSVTILTQPSGPVQTCAVTSGSGTASANVTSVQVACSTNEWIWVNGSNAVNQSGTYGSMGTATSTNVPGARSFAVSSADSTGSFWVWGGEAVDSNGSQGVINDVWKYSAGEWTWIGGSNLIFQPGIYGTQGIAAAGNIPGAREEAVSWTDAAGDFWLFGGYGLDSVNSAAGYGYLNDLWKYSGGEWTWMSGSNGINQAGTYGTQGIAAPGNVPGARTGAVSWIDAVGDLWLFGGIAVDSTGAGEYSNDLWKYSAGEWTWINGSNMGAQSGSYGTQGTAGSSNVPGGRAGAVRWIDAGGNFWLFGGDGLDGSGALGYLNDLWKYSGGEWTWMGGSNVVKQQGVYGTKGLADASNVPGARQSPITWIDGAGDVWLFGGQGLDSAGTGGNLNDLWRYSAGQWTWMSGSNVVYQQGTYGTQGLAASGNVPGARGVGVGWADAAGNLWLFGGNGSDSTGTVGILNDLWEYKP